MVLQRFFFFLTGILKSPVIRVGLEREVPGERYQYMRGSHGPFTRTVIEWFKFHGVSFKVPGALEGEGRKNYL